MPSRLVLLLIAVLAGCSRSPVPHDTPPRPLPTVRATAGEIAREMRLAGFVAPLQNVAISATLNEPAAEVIAREGDRVRAGDVLARFDVSDLQASLLAAERSAAASDAKAVQAQYQASLSIGQGHDGVRQAAASLRESQATRDQDARDLERNRALLVNGYVSQQAVDQGRTRVSNDEAAVANARAVLATAQRQDVANGDGREGLQAANVATARAEAASAHAQAEQIRSQIARATIVSPVDGVVTDRNLNPGEYPANRTIFTLQRLDAVEIVLSATASELAAAPKGTPVRIDVTGLTAPLRGRVSAQLGQTSPGSTSFTIKVLVPHPDPAVRSGMIAVARIATRPRSGSIVPTSAFADGTHRRVIVSGRDGYRAISVTELADDGDRSVVSGLPAGSIVVRDGYAAANVQ